MLQTAKMSNLLDTEISSIQRHYNQPNLESAIMNALSTMGKDLQNLKISDFTPVDQFHVRGERATVDLSNALTITSSNHILDVGCGIGGASRYLADKFGCQVTAVDLNANYCEVATKITKLLKLDPLVSFKQANATKLPFPDCSFDIIWTQHASMNISDKNALYAELWRVLKPSGKLALYDILSGSGGEIYFPVPWSRNGSTSFLITPETLLNTLATVGFKKKIWRDVTIAGRDWFADLQQKPAGKNFPLTIELLFGSDFKEMAKNQFLNLQENRIALIEAVFERFQNS